MRVREVPTDKDNELIFRYHKIELDVLLDKKISHFAKHLFSLMCVMDNDDRGCFASNGYLAAYFDCSEKTISRAIQELKDEGYIKIRFKKSKYRSIKVARGGDRFNYYKEDGKEKKVLSIEYVIKQQKERVNNFLEKENKPKWEHDEKVEKYTNCPSNLDKNVREEEQERPTNIIVNTKDNIIRNSSKEEIAEADGASDEAEQQDDCQLNDACSKDNNTWDSEVDSLKETNTEKQKLYPRDILYEMSKYEIKDYFVAERLMSECDDVSKIYQFIEPEEKLETTCNINSPCAIEKEQEVEVNTQAKPKVKNGTTTLTHKLADEWEKFGFKKVKQDELKYVKNHTDAFLNGSVFILNEIEKVEVSEDSFFQALKNRKNYIDSLIGKERTKQLGLCISYWLWNPKSKAKNKSQFLIDLSGYEKKLTDEYPELTKEIKKAYIKTFLGGLGGIDWSLSQEENFIKASKKVIKFLATNRKRLRSHWLHPKNDEIARWLVNSILESKNGVTKGVNTNYLCNKITIGESLRNYLESEAILNKD